MLTNFIRLIILAFILMGMTKVSAQPSPADAQYISNGNLLVNPSFEEGTSGWISAAGSLSIVTSDVYHLSRSAEIVLSAESLDLRNTFAISNGLAGGKVFISVAVQSSSPIEICSIVDAVEDNCVSSASSGDWEVISTNISALGSINSIIVKSSSITGTVRVDNAVVSTGALAAGGDAGLPPAGNTGSTLVKLSSIDGDADWDQLSFSGFSARFSETFSSISLRDTLEKILDLSYLPPLVSLSGSSNSLREKGATVSSITLSANVTKRSDNIARIRFFQGAILVQDYNPPATIGSGTTTAPYSVPFSDNIGFTVIVTDDGTSGGPTDVTSNTLTYRFVYPYYFGAGAQALTSAQVASLTKDIIGSTATLNRSFTTLAGQVYYFAYPASYGALTSILDENGFEVIGDWTLRTENITGLDASPVSYRIYEFNNPVTAGTTNFTFSR